MNLHLHSNYYSFLKKGNKTRGKELFRTQKSPAHRGRPTLRLMLLLIFLCMVMDSINGQTIRYVMAGATGAGTSWADASGDLQTTINSSAAGDQVWVASGIYKPIYRADNMSGTDANDRYNAFVLKKDIKIYGGFSGNETLLTQRDSTGATNTTILSGDLGTVGVTSDNAYHVIISAGPMGAAELNGFTIKSGNANGDNTLISVLFVSISNNRGGGIYNSYNSSSSPVFANLIINGNSAFYGGGIYNEQSSPILTHVGVSENSATVNGGAIYNFSSSSPILISATISGNTANGGGGIYNHTSSDPILTDVVISGNSASSGGGIYNFSSSPILTNVTISGNNAAIAGGGIANESSSAQIRNSIIYENNSGIAGSGFVIQYSLIQGSADVTNGNIDGSTDPQFINPVAAGLSTGGNYRLQSTSPAINGGNNVYFNAGQTPDLSAITTDLDGHARIQDEIIDMGSYENPLPEAVSGNISGAMTVCSATNNTTLTLNGYIGKIQWQSSTDNATFNNIDGASGATYTASDLTATIWYRAVVTSGGTSATSPAVAITVNQKSTAPIEATASPSTICNGGSTILTYHGGSQGTNAVFKWYTDAACTSPAAATGQFPTVSPTVTTTYYGRYEDPAPCNLVTATASVTVTVTPNASAGTVIAGTSPQCIGSTTTYTVSGVVLSGGTGAWSSDNTAVATVDASTGLVTAIGEGTCNIIYTVTGECNTATASQPYTVFAAPVISSQPQSQSINEGASATFSVLATGLKLQYQWQQYVNGGKEWIDVTNATDATYTAPSLKEGIYYYRAVIIGTCAQTISNIATLTVVGSGNPKPPPPGHLPPHCITPHISQQPTSQSVCIHADVTFNVTASDATGYQWQYATGNGKMAWTNIANATGSTFTLPSVSGSDNGKQYRVIVSGNCDSVTSKSATLTVERVYIEKEPQDVYVYLDKGPKGEQNNKMTQATFNVRAAGASDINYQWQLSTDRSATWNDISGATQSSLTINNITEDDDSLQYRVIVSGDCNIVTSGTATLKVNEDKKIVIPPPGGGKIPPGKGKKNVQQEYQVYPNPVTQSVLTIEDKLGNPLNEINLYNMAGRLLLTSQTQNAIINLQLPRLAAGNYMLQIIDQNHIAYSIQIVVQTTGQLLK